MNSALKASAAALVAFVVAYLLASAFQSERGNYRRLVTLANQRSGPLTTCASDLLVVGDRSSDKDIKFAATYLSTVFSTAADHGLQSCSSFGLNLRQRIDHQIGLRTIADVKVRFYDDGA